MDCSAYKELAGLRPEDLEPGEATDLQGHIESCEVCRDEQRYDEELLSLVDRLPSLDSTITAAEVRRRDGVEELIAPAEAPVTTPARGRQLGLVLLALAAAVALTLLIVPRFLAGPETGPQRLKGAVPGDDISASVDLQFSVESRLGDETSLSEGAEDGRYARDEAFIFGVLADHPGALTLVETGPDGRSAVVAPGAGAGWKLGESGLHSLADDHGQPLAYQPDGPAGTYRYTVLLTDAQSASPDAVSAARLARGESVPGVTLLTSDTFAVEWGVGE